MPGEQNALAYPRRQTSPQLKKPVKEASREKAKLEMRLNSFFIGDEKLVTSRSWRLEAIIKKVEVDQKWKIFKKGFPNI